MIEELSGDCFVLAFLLITGTIIVGALLFCTIRLIEMCKIYVIILSCESFDDFVHIQGKKQAVPSRLRRYCQRVGFGGSYPYY